MKYKNIFMQLKEEILTGQLTGSMPSMRSLMERFDVSHLTILHVFKELSEEGLISGGYKKNYTIKSLGVKENLLLCLMRPPNEINLQDNFSTEMCSSVIRTAQMYHMNVLFPHQNAGVLYGSSNDAFLQQMCSEMRPLLPYIRGVIAAGSITDFQLQQYILPFIEQKPVILLNRDSELENIGKVVFATEDGCKELVKLIQRQNCKKIVLCQTYLTTDRRNDHIYLLKDMLVNAAVDSSQITLLKDLLKTPDNNAIYKEMVEVVKQAMGETVIFVSSSTGACCVADALKNAGLVPGKDYKLCAFDGKIRTEVYDKGITSIKIPGDQLGKKAVDLLLSENPYRKVWVEPKLLLHETL